MQEQRRPLSSQPLKDTQKKKEWYKHKRIKWKMERENKGSNRIFSRKPSIREIKQRRRQAGGKKITEKFRREARGQNFGAQGLYDVANPKIHG